MMARARGWTSAGFGLAGSLAAVGLVALTPSCSEAPRDALDAPGAHLAVVQAELTAALDSSESARVIVGFREPTNFRVHDSSARRQVVERLRGSILARSGDGLTVSHRYRDVPALAGRISRAALARLERDPDVAYVQLDTPGRGQLKESVPASGADQVQSVYGLTGKGVRVAVLDSGAQIAHPDLTGAVVAQQCFTQGGCGGWAASTGENAEDDHGHGTSIAGIIASRGQVSSPGFAPESELVVVKVNDSTNYGYASDWVAGLEWINTNFDTLQVDVINLSIGTDFLYDSAENCDAQQPALASAIANLREKGAIVVAAVGNRASATSVVAPACISGVIAVGTAYDSHVGGQPPDADDYRAAFDAGFAACRDDPTEPGQIACFTNVGPRLDVIIPSSPMLSATLRGGSAVRWGTSLSAAAVSGVAALARQCNDGLTSAALREALISTGLPRAEPMSGRPLPVVRALELVRSVCPGLNAEATDAGAMMPATDPAGGAAPRAGARAAGRLAERYTGGAPAPPLGGSSRPVTPAADGGDAAQPAGDGGEQDASAEAAPRDDEPKPASTSGDDYSCRTAGDSRDLGELPWLGGLCWAGVWLLQRRRVRRRER